MSTPSRTLLLVGAILVAINAASSGGSLDLLLDVHGEGYRGAIVPAERLPRFLGPRNNGTWTLTREEARRAEAALRDYLSWGLQNRERFEPNEDWYVRESLPYVVKGLSKFTRYYLGRFVDPAVTQDLAEGRHILVIGVDESYTRDGDRDRWLSGVPQVFDGACSYWRFYWNPETEQPIKFVCNGNP